jgi:hypothetical protein
MWAVGVGCWWFAMRSPPPRGTAVDEDEHLRDIEAALKSIENISNVEIRTGGSLLLHLFEFDETEDLFPAFVKLTVDFDVFLPASVAEKYGDRRGISADIDSFHVTIASDWDAPVVYVSYETNEDKSKLRHLSPSSAVSIVQNLLIEKLSDHPSLVLRAVGPTPMHADIFVSETSPEDESATVTIDDLTPTEGGYRTIHVELTGTSVFTPVQDFIRACNPLIGCYYRVAALRAKLGRRTEEIIKQTERLIAEPENRSPLATCRRYIEQRKTIDAVFKSIFDATLNDLQVAEYVRTLSSRRILDDKDDVFCKMVEGKLAESYSSTLPLVHVEEILKLYEQRRQAYFRNVLSLSIAAAGGLLGAAAFVLVAWT